MKKMEYLLIVNGIAFACCLINWLIHRHAKHASADKLFPVLALLGGTIGVIVFLLLFDRKSIKENMMSRVFLMCILVVQVVLCLFFQGLHGETTRYDIFEFFKMHKMFVYYLVAMNVIAFGAFAIDKHHAIKGKTRIRIITLLCLAFFGGSLGALLGMYTLRHKTKVNYFTVGVPCMMVMQAVVLFFFMNIR